MASMVEKAVEILPMYTEVLLGLTQLQLLGNG